MFSYSLLENRFAPLTFSIGFIEGPLSKVSEALTGWRKSHSNLVEIKPIESNLPCALVELEPLITPRRRELLLATKSKWVAYFDNGLRGGDPVSAIGHLCRLLECPGLATTCKPDIRLSGSKNEKALYSSVQFQMFASEKQEFLNYERSIAVINDGGRWEFVSIGKPQAFEEVERYKNKKIAERFTPEMLEGYCSALGVKLFQPDFYGPAGMLVYVRDPLPPRFVPLSLAEARRRLGVSD